MYAQLDTIVAMLEGRPARRVVSDPNGLGIIGLFARPTRFERLRALGVFADDRRYRRFLRLAARMIRR